MLAVSSWDPWVVSCTARITNVCTARNQIFLKYKITLCTIVGLKFGWNKEYIWRIYILWKNFKINKEEEENLNRQIFLEVLGKKCERIASEKITRPWWFVHELIHFNISKKKYQGDTYTLSNNLTKHKIFPIYLVESAKQ